MYPADYRLRKSKDIEKLFKYGKSFLAPLILLRFAKNNLKQTRLAVIVGTKVHKRAVKRNLIKRRLREAVKAEIPRLKSSYDIAIMARPAILNKDSEEIVAALAWSLGKAGVLEE